MFMAFPISSCPSEERVSQEEDDSVNMHFSAFRPYTNLMQLQSSEEFSIFCNVLQSFPFVG